MGMATFSTNVIFDEMSRRHAKPPSMHIVNSYLYPTLTVFLCLNTAFANENPISADTDVTSTAFITAVAAILVTRMFTAAD